jgi:hypothetical protein
MLMISFLYVGQLQMRRNGWVELIVRADMRLAIRSLDGETVHLHGAHDDRRLATGFISPSGI